jgi:hypothetical protein
MMIVIKDSQTVIAPRRMAAYINDGYNDSAIAPGAGQNHVNRSL